MNIIIPMLALTPHGGNRVLIQIANFLCEKGHEVTLITTTKNQSPFVISDKVNVNVIFNRYKNKHIRFLMFILFCPIYFRCDIVISNHFLTYFPAQLSTFFFRSKNLFFVQGVESECFDSYSRPLKYLLRGLNELAFKSKYLITANPYLSRRVRQYTSISHEFNLGISKKWLRKSSVHKEYDIIYFARDECNKGLDRFLDIYSLNSELKYLCISQDEKLLKKLSNNHGVEVYKPCSDSDIYNCLDKSKVLLLTSYKEGFALPPLEGMFRGVPFIYFDCGGPSVYANFNNSILINKSSEFKESFKKIDSSYDFYSRSCVTTAKEFVLEDSLLRLNEHITGIR